MAAEQLRRCLPCVRVAIHRLGQLCIHFVRDDHDIRQECAEIQSGQMLVQRPKDGHLKDS